jgi:hypothetical protein
VLVVQSRLHNHWRQHSKGRSTFLSAISGDHRRSRLLVKPSQINSRGDLTWISTLEG